jgi:serine/threonine protein kinase
MKSCEHPNVLRYHTSFVHSTNLYTVMPLLEGSMLCIMRTLYPRGMEESVILAILKQALAGLNYLHRNGHVHRDFKAGNILLTTEGQCLLADFGVSATLKLDRYGSKRKRNTFVGTPCWMAPEVLEHAGYDDKADCWSFGITALEMALGHAPLSKYPPVKVIRMTISEAPPTLLALDKEMDKNFSRNFKDMIAACLNKDPAKRIDSAKLMEMKVIKGAKSHKWVWEKCVEPLPPVEERADTIRSAQRLLNGGGGVPGGGGEGHIPPKSADLVPASAAMLDDLQKPLSGIFVRGMTWDFTPSESDTFQDAQNPADLLSPTTVTTVTTVTAGTTATTATTATAATAAIPAVAVIAPSAAATLKEREKEKDMKDMTPPLSLTDLPPTGGDAKKVKKGIRNLSISRGNELPSANTGGSASMNSSSATNNSDNPTSDINAAAMGEKDKEKESSQSQIEELILLQRQQGEMLSQIMSALGLKKENNPPGMNVDLGTPALSIINDLRRKVHAVVTQNEDMKRDYQALLKERDELLAQSKK